MRESRRTKTQPELVLSRLLSMCPCVCTPASIVSGYSGENDLDHQDRYQSHTLGHAPSASPVHTHTRPVSLRSFGFTGKHTKHAAERQAAVAYISVCICAKVSSQIEVYSDLAGCQMFQSHMVGQ